MPSTDIDGEPLLIIGRSMAARIISMAERLGQLDTDEQALIDRINATFPPVGDRDLRLSYDPHESAHEISYVVNSNGDRWDKQWVLCRISYPHRHRVSVDLDALRQLSTWQPIVVTEHPPSTLDKTVSAGYYKLPDTPEVRGRIEAIKKKLV